MNVQNGEEEVIPMDPHPPRRIIRVRRVPRPRAAPVVPQRVPPRDPLAEITVLQRNQLENFYTHRSQEPTNFNVRALSRTTGLEKRLIRIWFNRQNAIPTVPPVLLNPPDPFNEDRLGTLTLPKTTHTQFQALEMFFDLSKARPNRDDLKKFCDKSGLSCLTVKRWFAARRYQKKLEEFRAKLKRSSTPSPKAQKAPLQYLQYLLLRTLPTVTEVEGLENQIAQLKNQLNSEREGRRKVEDELVEMRRKWAEPPSLGAQGAEPNVE